MAGGGWRTGREWGDLDIALARAMASLGLTGPQAARHLQRSRNSMSYIAARHKFSFQPRPKVWHLRRRRNRK
jgi:hypothetical protein